MESTGRKWLVILNPASGTGRRRGIDLAIQDGFKSLGISAQVKTTGRPGEATNFAAEAASQFEVIIAAGGDGTVRETAAGILGSKTALGILPLGSGNGLARHLRLSGHLTAAMEQLAKADVHQADAYLINGRVGVNVGGIGFDGEIARLFDGQKKRGLFGYLRLILSRFSKYPEFEAKFSVDGRTESVNAFMVCAANGSQFGNNAMIAREAQLTDGMLDIRIMRKPSWVQTLRLFFSLHQGLESKLISTYMATNLILNTNAPQPIHADGDFIELTDRIEIKILPSSLRLLVPRF